MLSENATKLLDFMVHEKTNNQKENFAIVDFLGAKGVAPISVDEIDRAIKELYSKGIVNIAKNIASTVSLTEYGLSIAKHR